MRRIFYPLLLLIPAFSYAQITCVVTPADTLICFRDTMAFETTVTGVGPFTYQWQKDQVDIPGATDSILAFSHVLESDTGFYRCIAFDGMNADTSNDGHLRMHPVMQFDTLYRYNDLGCRGDCKGQFKTLISGGTPPYHYEWGGGYSQDTIVFGLCMGDYTLTVEDVVGCMIDSAYYVDVLQSPKISFISYLTDYYTPEDDFYLTNPNVTVEFPPEYRDSIVNWEWNFGDEYTVPDVNPVTHLYTKTGKFTILLIITDHNGCDTTATHDITVKVAKLNIAYAFSPNGDGLNDEFMIEIEGENPYPEFSDAYLGNEIVIYDRWGKKVYSKMNYRSGDWDGGNLPDGVYFYILKCIGQYGDEVYRGAIHILGRGL